MDPGSDNPLLTPQFEIPFDRIRPEHVEPAIAQLLTDAQAALDQIGQPGQPGQIDQAAAPTYDSTLGALERTTERLEYAMGLVGHLESVATTPPLREAYNAVQPLVSAFYSQIPLHEGLWRALRAFSETEEARGLTGAQARFLKKTLDDFRRHGALLDEPGKQRLRELDVELSQLCTRFAQNVLDETAAFELYIEEGDQALAGLPEGARLLCKDGAEQRGRPGYRLSLHEPVLVAVLTYADDEALRQRLYRAYNTRATTAERDNRPLIARILELRKARARLLGYATFADLVLADRMAKEGATATGFLDDLRRRTLQQFAQEGEALAAFRRQLEGPDAPAPRPWDLAYYAEKQRTALYDFDEEALRPYLPVEKVLQGLFQLAQRLYGIRIEPHPLPAWDEAVRSYAVYDSADRGGQMLAAFYVDLFPRDNKRGGAWMNTFITGAAGAADPRHVGLLCANVQPPVGGQPALLSHREMETLAHELGHLLHLILSRVPVRSLAGTNVAWDFVELPSQIMENFCWERASLDLLSGHHETGAPLPGELLDRMRRARTYRAATATMRQLGFGTLDLLMHTSYDPAKDGEVMAFARRIFQDHAPAELPEDYAMLAGFGHLFGSPVGYAAAYYSYKWAEVLDADAFSRFKEDGVVSAAVGRDFRERLLEKGDSEDPMDLFIAFRGRPPRLEPLLERAGLQPASQG